MEARVTIRIEVVDEIGRPMSTVEKTARKDTGGNPRFFLPELTPVSEQLLDEVVMLAAIGVDKTRAVQYVTAKSS